jgi:2,3-bisphosphoglycerate-dependent phosphoglycerate mutase
MHLYFIRHAQSANNEMFFRTGTNDGRTADPQLTELGHRQAQLLGRFLAGPKADQSVPETLLNHFAARHDRGGFGLTHLYCSLMIRAVQTAAYIAEATGLPLVGWPEIHERGGLHDIDESTGEDIGIAGPNQADLFAQFPHLILPDTVGDAGWWSRPPETVAETVPRARAVWRQLLERHGGTDDRVAFVSHGGFFQSLLTALLSTRDELAPEHLGLEALWFGVSNTSISRFEIANGHVVARYLNRVDFLPDELLTG